MRNKANEKCNLDHALYSLARAKRGPLTTKNKLFPCIILLGSNEKSENSACLWQKLPPPHPYCPVMTLQSSSVTSLWSQTPRTIGHSGIKHLLSDFALTLRALELKICHKAKSPAFLTSALNVPFTLIKLQHAYDTSF